MALGILATVLAFVFIEGTAGQERGPRTRIVVASRDLRPNATLDPDKDLKVEEIPTRYGGLAAQSLNPDGLSNYRGQRVNRRIYAGQPVLLADLGAVAELELRPGERALTLQADPGIIIPGDYVKLLVSRPEMPPPNATAANAVPTRGGYQVTLIGQGNGYRVLAVGNSLFKTRQQVTAAEQYEGGSNARSVTLAVTEQEATEIQAALGAGQARPTLLLCAPQGGQGATTQP